jgi:AcrR family transcriptional regulator
MREEFYECAWPAEISELLEENRRHERRDAAEHRQRILEVARRLFAEQGVEAVSMHQIAQAAGIGQGTLYRRYANKSELCLDLFREPFKRFGEAIATLLTQVSTTPALERLEGVLARMVQFLEDQNAMGGLIAGTEGRNGQCNDADVFRYVAFQTTPWYRWLHELLAGLLTEAVQRSELATLDIPYTADTILSALHPAVYRFQRQERGFSTERILQGLHQIYIEGVKAPPTLARRADVPPTL